MHRRAVYLKHIQPACHPKAKVRDSEHNMDWSWTGPLILGCPEDCRFSQSYSVTSTPGLQDIPQCHSLMSLPVSRHIPHDSSVTSLPVSRHIPHGHSVTSLPVSRDIPQYHLLWWCSCLQDNLQRCLIGFVVLVLEFQRRYRRYFREHKSYSTQTASAAQPLTSSRCLPCVVRS